VPGSHFDPGDCGKAFFLDGVFFPVSKFGQGPESGDYIGAMRVAGNKITWDNGSCMARKERTWFDDAHIHDA